MEHRMHALSRPCIARLYVPGGRCPIQPSNPGLEEIDYRTTATFLPILGNWNRPLPARMSGAVWYVSLVRVLPYAPLVRLFIINQTTTCRFFELHSIAAKMFHALMLPYVNQTGCKD